MTSLSLCPLKPTAATEKCRTKKNDAEPLSVGFSSNVERIMMPLSVYTPDPIPFWWMALVSCLSCARLGAGS
jgi:hypothetical protein